MEFIGGTAREPKWLQILRIMRCEGGRKEKFPGFLEKTLDKCSAAGSMNNYEASLLLMPKSQRAGRSGEWWQKQRAWRVMI
jgi:hypothetical protein